MSKYFDYNASAPTREEVIDAMTEVLRGPAGNPSSMHGAGRAARGLLDQARQSLASLVGADPSRVVFTSGATEANNYALRGFLHAHPEGTAVVTTIDHHSLLATVDALEAAGSRVVRLSVDGQARPDLERIRELCESGPCIVSTAWANGETGHIADVAGLSQAVTEGSLLHMDGAQAVGRIPVCLGDNVDMLSLSAHKFGGPKGVGAVVVGDQALPPLLTGGPQESGLRAGTENLAGIVGMGVAAQLCSREMESETARLGGLRESLWQRLDQALPGLLRLTPAEGLANTLTLALAGIGADVVVAALDLCGFAVSTGSACAAGAPEPSHVVVGLGVEERYRRGVVRISMGPATTPADVDGLALAFIETVSRARKAV